MTVLGLLPPIAFVSVFLFFGNHFPAWGWRRTFVRSSVLAGSYMVLATETLSLARAITRPGLAGIWGAPLIAITLWFAIRIKRGLPIRMPRLQALSPFEGILVLGIVAIAAVTATIAWVSPPNTWDSLTYHMSRVAHWAQDESLQPFATGIERQNFMSPVAEIGMLQVYVLAGGDRWVNFIEWSAMLVSLAGVGLLAKDMGAGRLGQLLSMVFVASLPMGIAQASSTMTDYVVSAGAIAVACEAFQLAKAQGPGAPAFFASLAAGLSLGAKPTSAAYLLPLAVFIAVALLRGWGGLLTMRAAIAAVGIVLILNAGYLVRNAIVYGVPVGGQYSGDENVNDVFGLRVLVSNVLRNASLHAGTPSPYLNKALVLGVRKIHEWMGIDPTDPRTTVNQLYRVGPPSTSEVKAGNTAQAILILASCVLLVWRRDLFAPRVFSLALSVAFTFVIFSALFKFTVFGSRYHLPFFILFAPIVGYVLSRTAPSSLTGILAVGLILASWPWLVHLDPRPLLETADGQASILSQSRQSLYLELDPGAEEPYQELTAAIKANGCSAVGLMLSGGAAEYPLWAYLGAPRDDLRLEWIVGGTPSARFADPSFEPCAVVCDASCARDLTSFRGLEQVYSQAGYRLFLGEPRPAGS
jgi:hypothetical protein